MNYAQIRQYDVANGPGVRSTIFFSGCRFNCKDCFNKAYQDFKYGHEWTKEVEDNFIEMIKDPKISGVSILGGEPMQQDPHAMYKLLKRIKEEANKNIWMWTGYVYGETLPPFKREMINEFVDVLVDGQFIKELKDLNLAFRGSSNQRLIDIKETIKSDKIVLVER